MPIYVDEAQRLGQMEYIGYHVVDRVAEVGIYIVCLGSN